MEALENQKMASQSRAMESAEDEGIRSNVSFNLARVVATEDFIFEFMKNKFITNKIAQRIYSATRSFGTHIYIFTTKTENRVWQIRRRYQDFVTLQKDLFHETKLGKIASLVSLPKLPEAKNSTAQELGTNLAVYLQDLSENRGVREHITKFWEFIEYGRVSLDENIKKFKEGNILKRAGGRYRENNCLMYFGVLCRSWKVRWFVVCEEGVLYTINSSQTKVREMLLFDNTFTYLIGREHTGTNRGITLMTPTRKLCLRAFDLFQVIDWFIAIEEARTSSSYTVANRFLSFAPITDKNANCKFYIDGEHYYSEVCDQINKAQREIFISGWWLSPELYLKRPVSDTLNQDSRLDRVLQNASNRGVKIHIILYKEFSALCNDSKYTKKALEALSENIEVLTHPGNLIFLWSHHEKMVIIDQTVGFLGGLDLCYGRNDSNRHALSDESWLTDRNLKWFPGIDYYNVRVGDFTNVHEYHVDMYDRLNIQRMPWHDVAVLLIGESVKDMSRHFIQYWNYVKSDLAPKDKQYFLVPLQKVTDQTIFVGDGLVLQENQTFFQRIESIVQSKIFRKTQKDLEQTILDPMRNRQHQKDNKRDIYIEMSEILKSKGPSSKGNDAKDLFYEEEIKHQIEYLEKFKIDEVKPDVHAQTEEEFISRSESIMTESHSEPPESQHTSKFSDEQPQTNQTLFHAGSDESDRKSSHSNEIERQNSDFIPMDHSHPPKNTTLNSSWAFGQAEKTITQVYETTEKTESISSTLRNRNNDSQNQSKMWSRTFTMHSEKTIPSRNLQRRNAVLSRTKTVSIEPLKLDKGFLQMITKVVNQPKHFNEEIDYFVYRDPELLKATNKQEISRRSETNTQRGDGVNRQEKFSFRLFGTGKKKSVQRDDDALELLKPDLKPKQKITGSCRCQLVRSASPWSMGLRGNTKESSIQIAYLEMIQNSKHFIYIENQFFISASAGKEVHNQISEAIILRIRQAAADKQKFRVMVMIPLLPGFEGDIGGSSGALLKVQLHWQYQTICRGGTSIIECLKNDPNIENPFDYIYFFSLRQHGILNGEPKTELIYIHSKVMIVDDNVAIIGSANINDRSMVGTRDSELCMIIEDEEKIKSKFDNKPWIAANFAHNLRMELLKEHFNFDDKDLQDPICEKFWKMAISTAGRNTEIYREIFAPYPDDTVKSLATLQEFMSKKDISLYSTLSKEILGHVVEFPLRFLEDENLKLSIFNKEYYVPDINFT